jgi:hypothetical protein
MRAFFATMVLLVLIAGPVAITFIVYQRESILNRDSLALRNVLTSELLNDGAGLAQKDQVNMFIRISGVDFTSQSMRLGLRYEARGSLSDGDLLKLPVPENELLISISESGSRLFSSGGMPYVSFVCESNTNSQGL